MGFLSKAFDSVKNFVSDNAGSLIGGAAGLAGDYLGSRADQKASEEANRANIQFQTDFATNGVRWKASDARAAGIHPLYAMGAQTNMPSVAIQGTRSGDTWRSMGQNVSRAVAATQTAEQRIQTALTTQNMKLQNDMLRAQIGNEVAKQPRNPPMPGLLSSNLIPGQGDTALELPSPKPSLSYSKNRDQSLDVTPSQDFTDRNQNLISGMIPEVKWFLRNQMLPIVDDLYRTITRKGYPLEKVNGRLYYRRGSTLHPYKGH